MDFWEIYHEHYQPVRSFIAAMVRDDWAADDLVQETFINAEQKLDTLKDPEKVKPWLFRIARNKCLDHFRRVAACRERPEPQREKAASPDPPLIQLQLEQGEMSSCVQEKIGRLSESYRTVLILFDLMEMSHKEIAEVLEDTVGNIKVRLHRARQALKEILEQECSFERDERNVLICIPVDEGT